MNFKIKWIVFCQTLSPIDKVMNNFTPYDYNTKEFANVQAINSYSLFEFDPNTIDSLSLLKLGLKPYVVKNILNYRRKGGRFYTSKDFRKIYGITDNVFIRLEPYIAILQKESKENNFNKKEIDTLEKTIKSQNQYDIIVELNSADTTELKKLQGVGSYFAKQIVLYRKKLGGYYSISQLLEIKNFSEERLDKISDNLSVDMSKIEPINVNWATVERLDKHPYLNFYQSKAIFEFRKKGKLHSLEDIKKLDEFSDKDLDRLKPYLKF